MKYKNKEMTYSDLKNDLELPEYQRRLVWSKNQKKAFVETLTKGYPFGSILLYRDPAVDGKYLLIDGLQRFSTIKDFEENPEDYLNTNDLAIELYDMLDFWNATPSTEKKFIEQCNKIIKDYIISKSKVEEDKYELYEILRKDNGLLGNTKFKEKLAESEYATVRDYIGPFQKKIEARLNKVDLSKLEIPTIIFTGDQTELTEVFHNLNIGGKKLSKYQVFAAQWYDSKINLNNSKVYGERIINIIIDRYEELNNSRGIEIKDYNRSDIEESKIITFPEFIYAMGVLIIEKMPAFYEKKEKVLEFEDESNELGYSTLAITLDLANKNMHHLLKFHNFFEDGNIVDSYVENVLDIYNEINLYFSKYLRFWTNNRVAYSSQVKTNFMILSYFSSLWTIKYSVDFENVKIKRNEGTKKDISQIKNHLIFYLA